MRVIRVARRLATPQISQPSVRVRQKCRDRGEGVRRIVAFVRPRLSTPQFVRTPPGAAIQRRRFCAQQFFYQTCGQVRAAIGPAKGVGWVVQAHRIPPVCDLTDDIVPQSIWRLSVQNFRLGRFRERLAGRLISNEDLLDPESLEDSPGFE